MLYYIQDKPLEQEKGMRQERRTSELGVDFTVNSNVSMSL